MTEMKRWIGYGAAATLVLLLAVACGDGEDSPTGAGDKAPTSTENLVSVDGTGNSSSLASSTAAFSPDAELLVRSFNPFEPGTYRSNALGTPVSFTADEPLSTQFNNFGIFVVTALPSVGPDDRDLVMLRVSGLSDPAQPSAPLEEQTLWPAGDLSGWLAAVEGVEHSEPVPTSVGGLSGIYTELRLSDDVECSTAPDVCIEFASNRRWPGKPLQKGSEYRVWMLEQGGFDPLILVAAIGDPDDAAWFATADELLTTVAFGEPAENPVVAVSGPAEIDVLGGIAVQFPDERLMIRRAENHGFVSFEEDPVTVEFALDPLTFVGEPIADVDALIEELTQSGVNVTNVRPTTIDGLAGTVAELDGGNVDSPILRFARSDVDTGLGFYPPARGRIWMLEHPDRGLVTIAASSFVEASESFDLVSEWGNQLVESLRFVELD